MVLRMSIFFLILSLHSVAQIPKASFYEIKWALFHPFAALKVRKITKICERFEKQNPITVLDSFSNGGKKDAWRHTFFMAAYSQKIKIKKLRKLGKAHEKANYRYFLKAKAEEGEQPDSLGSVMDLKNNELGFLVGRTHKTLSLEALNTLVISRIQIGEAVIMKRDKAGNYLTCDGNSIDLKRYQKSWSVPKCLISSDQ